jgi:hypothetical protein
MLVAPLIVTNSTMAHLWLFFIPVFVIFPLVKMILGIIFTLGIVDRLDKRR